MKLELNLWPRLVAGLALFFLLGIGLVPARAQVERAEVARLDSRVAALEHQIPTHATEGAAIFLCGAFCALWAQNTRRNAWLWFFLGLLFNGVTVLVLLYKNSRDRRMLAV